MRDGYDCPCGEWKWRETIATTSLAAFERSCPRCRHQVLLVFRGPVFVAAIQYRSADDRSFADALRKAGMHEHEVELLLTVARLMAAS